MSFSYEKAKRQLVEEQDNLVEQLQQLKESAEYESIGYSNHMADDATNAFDQAVDNALKQKLEKSLAAIQVALTKFDNGTYGLCETCGARIERARLEALPHAKYCLHCQQRRELS